MVSHITLPYYGSPQVPKLITWLILFTTITFAFSLTMIGFNQAGHIMDIDGVGSENFHPTGDFLLGCYPSESSPLYK